MTDTLAAFIQSLEPPQRAAFTALDSLPAIQAFLDAIPCSCEPVYRSPRQVLGGRITAAGAAPDRRSSSDCPDSGAVLKCWAVSPFFP